MGLVECIGGLLTFDEGLELEVDEGLAVRDMEFFFWPRTI